MDYERARLAASLRVWARKDIRAANVQALTRLLSGAKVDPDVVEPIDRQMVRARLLRREDLVVGLGRDSEASSKLLEALVGDNDLLPRRFLDSGASAANSVGRIRVRLGGSSGRYGTGSLVGSRFLLTNNHVLDSRDAAANATLELGYYESVSLRSNPQAFAIDPDGFFYTSEQLDFTLVALQTMNGVASSSDYGNLELIRASGKALVGEKVNIIQHADGQPQTIAIRANTIVDVFDQFVHYTTDTAPGSSGAPVFNDDWQLVALHHAAVPIDPNDPNGAVVNEGVRISAILDELAGSV